MNARKNYLMIVATVVVVVAFVGINGCEKSSDADAKAACCPSCGQAKDAASVALCNAMAHPSYLTATSCAPHSQVYHSASALLSSQDFHLTPL